MTLGGQAFKPQAIEEENVAEGLVNRAEAQWNTLFSQANLFFY